MIELKTSIWDARFDGYWRTITINTVIKADGCLVMGAGLAKQAAERYPDLPIRIGRLRTRNYRGLSTIEQYKIIGFPTKIDYRDTARLDLIELNLQNLLACFPNEKIVCPRLGCGLGQLDWETQVRPLMERYFGDDDNLAVVNL